MRFSGIVMILIFAVDYLLIVGTNRLTGFRAEGGRAAYASFIGALYALACMHPRLKFLGNGLWRCVFFLITVIAAFGCERSAVKRGGVFLLLSMALGGAAGMTGRGAVGGILLSAGLIFLLCHIGFGGRIGGREFLPIEIRYHGKSVRLIALRDTGNALCDPITGESVLLIDAAAAEDLTGLGVNELRTPLETAQRHPFPGLRIVPYHTIGKENGMLLAMRFSDVKIGKENRSVIVAFAAEEIGRGEGYRALCV